MHSVLTLAFAPGPRGEQKGVPVVLATGPSRSASGPSRSASPGWTPYINYSIADSSELVGDNHGTMMERLDRARIPPLAADDYGPPLPSTVLGTLCAVIIASYPLPAEQAAHRTHLWTLTGGAGCSPDPEGPFPMPDLD